MASNRGLQVDTVTGTDPEALTAATPEASAGGEQAVPPKPVRQVILDMVRSLGVVAVIVAVTLIFVPNLIHPGKSSRVQPVDYSEDALGFRQVTGIAPYAPDGLPSGWYPNAATFSRQHTVVHLHIGWVTPDQKYAGLEETNGPAPAFLSRILGKRGAAVTGHVVVNGRSWATRTSADGERSLTASLGRVTVVITGSASAAQEQQLAAALRPDTAAIS